MTQTLRIATRRSDLAMWQARHVESLLCRAYPDLEVSLVPLSTRGDRIQDRPLQAVGGKGLFIKELERALLEDGADLAVHSMKDVPAELPEPLHLPIILERGDARDAFVSARYADLGDLPPGARLGTSSLRRQCQMRSARPDLEVGHLRGNVNTRLRKLDEGQFDAIILAAAGLRRLGMTDRITMCLPPGTSLPAIGQGALGIECRRDDTRVNRLVSVLEHGDSAVCVSAERAMNARLHGDCHVPVAGYAVQADGGLWLRGLVGRPDGGEVVRGEVRGPARRATELGVSLAEDLLVRGAGDILRSLGVEPPAAGA
ncbi:MAG TPA: hydroxymethylbilane synthase [Gammaproteobacteria bacterium]|nr:hydroxymethylbilane synthase [Gammaproteobacteria bacterium]